MEASDPALQSADITVDVLNVVFIAYYSLIVVRDQSMVGNAVVAGESFILAVAV